MSAPPDLVTPDLARPDLLAAIVAGTRHIVAQRRSREPLADLERRTTAARPRGALFESRLGRTATVNVIAECKRRSPSKGVLAVDYDPVAIARRYEEGGAAAISVLTEPTFFDGALEHLTAVRAAVDVPVLRKDFIVEPYQLLEARAAGADAVLLIVAALEQAVLVDLQRRAWDLGLATLVEVHDDEELSRAVASGARVIGVNNRSLKTLAVDVDASYRLAARMPPGVIAVSESGLRSREDLARLSAAGYRAFLIGERFMTDPDPAGAIRGLVCPVAKATSGAMGAFLKICGITREADALHAVEHGATALGFVFWPPSPRAVSVEQARAIVDALPAGIATVGVFVNQAPVEIERVMAASGVRTAQLHGDESPEVAAALSCPLLRSADLARVEAIGQAWPEPTVLLLDAYDPERRGGTGTTVDWIDAAAVARRRRVVLAGGLTPANVAEAIAAVEPFGVDVSSGVEQTPGVKDPEKVQQFLENARAAFDVLQRSRQRTAGESGGGVVHRGSQ